MKRVVGWLVGWLVGWTDGRRWRGYIYIFLKIFPEEKLRVLCTKQNSLQHDTFCKQYFEIERGIVQEKERGVIKRGREAI